MLKAMDNTKKEEEAGSASEVWRLFPNVRPSTK
jgi:hypothetical protein